MAGPSEPGLVQQGGVATEHRRVSSVETCTGRVRVIEGAYL